MSSTISQLAKDLQKVMEEKDRHKTAPIDTRAEVVDVEDDIVWVHFPGGVDKTPVSKTINAKKGDIVQVRASDGRAWIVGNSTNPPTDDTEAITAGKKANDAIKISDQALKEAERAGEAADKAEREAVRAGQAADRAEDSAQEAQAQAVSATKSANAALSQLGIVEDVVGTLSWISEHATYKASSDTEVEEGKYYFTRSGDTYNIVLNPAGDPSSLGYYEIDSIDEAVSNYVASHLALTNAGLWVVNDNNSYKILLASDGMKVYDASGNLVSTFGESITFSSSKAQYIGGENAYIVFDPTTGAMTIGGSNLNITSNVTIGGENKTLSQIISEINDSVADVQDMQARMDSGEFKGEKGDKGEDAVLVYIHSSNGTAFKNSEINTVLTVTIHYGTTTITNKAGLIAAFGSGAYLQWKVRLHGQTSYSTIPASDTRLSDNGFTFTISPSDVNVQAVFNAQIVIPD